MYMYTYSRCGHAVNTLDCSERGCVFDLRLELFHVKKWINDEVWSPANQTQSVRATIHEGVPCINNIYIRAC